MMRFELEEQEGSRYLIYHKQDTDMVSRLVMGMIKNNTIEGTVPFLQSQMNTEIQYRYDITGKKSLAEYFGNVLSKAMLLGVLENILACKTALEDYMLDMNAVVLDSQYIFVNPASGKVEMIVLPVEHENMPMEQFFRTLIFSARYDPAEDGSYIASLLSYFNSGEAFSAVSFAKKLQELKTKNSWSVNTQPKASAPKKQPTYDPCGETVPLSTLMNPSAKSDPVGANPVPQKFEEDEGTTVLSKDMQIQAQLYANPNLQKKTGQPGNFYPGQQPVKPLSGNVQKYVNPNLGNMQTPSSGNMPKVYPGAIGNAAPKQMEVPVPQTNAEDAEKEKKGLFGKKEKKSEKKGLFGKKDKETTADQAQTGKKPLSFKGIAIPGSDVVQTPENAGVGTPETAVPVQQVQMPIHNAPIQDFGNTVDLQTYAQETSVLNGGQASAAISPCLMRKTTKEQFFLTKAVTRIGRSRDNVDIYITDNTSIGRVHAVLYWENGRVYIEDQHSTNGTFVNDRKITGKEELTSGSRIRLSNEEFEFRLL